MKKRFDGFKKFVEKIKDRSSHMGWKISDVEHHGTDDEHEEKDRSGHLGWNVNDVEHHKNEDINEAAGVNKTYGGLKNPLGGIPKYWKPGGMGASHDDAGWQSGKAPKGLPVRPPERDKKPYHSDHPDQLGLFKEKKKKAKEDPHKIHQVDYNHLPDEGETNGDIRGTRHENHIKSFADNHATLNYTHKASIGEYKAASFGMNEQLRNSKGRPNKSYKRDVRNLDHVTSLKTPHDMTVYRGVHSSEFLDYPVGHKFTDHGFTSTSLDHQRAKNFSHNTKDVFRIHVPEGTKGHYIDSHMTNYQSEHEFLLHRGTTFKIAKHSETPNGKRIIDLHIVKQRQPKEQKPGG